MIYRGFIIERKTLLLVAASQLPKQVTVLLNFMVVWVPLAYNAILGWLGLNALKVVVFTYHLLLHFSTKHGVGEIRED